MALWSSLYLWFPLLSICSVLPRLTFWVCLSAWNSVTVFQQTDSACIYAERNIPLSGFSAAHRLDIKILLDSTSPGNPKRSNNNFFLNRRSSVIWHLHSNPMAELVVPLQMYLSVTIWTHTHIYTHRCIFIYLYSQLTTLHMYTPARTYTCTHIHVLTPTHISMHMHIYS